MNGAAQAIGTIGMAQDSILDLVPHAHLEIGCVCEKFVCT